jgi:hypothetical protein
MYSDICGPSLAVIPTAVTESVISIGSQARNAQMAYNITAAPAARVSLQFYANPVTIGLPAHIMRNACAMSGIRILTDPCENAVDAFCAAVGAQPDKRATKFASDFSASVLAATVSMPFNQIFNFLVVSRQVTWRTALSASLAFLKSQYFVESHTGRLRVSRVAVRDIFMRCAYIAPQLSTFVTIERLCVDYFRSRDQMRGRSER